MHPAGLSHRLPNAHRYRQLPRGATILVIGASGTVGTALLDLAHHLDLKAIGTCSATNIPTVERLGATAFDYRAGDFVAAVRDFTAAREGGIGVDAAFDAIGGAHFARSFACVAPGGLLVGYGAQTMAVGGAGLASAALGLAWLKLWDALSGLFGGRRAVFYHRPRAQGSRERIKLTSVNRPVSHGPLQDCGSSGAHDAQHHLYRRSHRRRAVHPERAGPAVRKEELT